MSQKNIYTKGDNVMVEQCQQMREEAKELNRKLNNSSLMYEDIASFTLWIAENIEYFFSQGPWEHFQEMIFRWRDLAKCGRDIDIAHIIQEMATQRRELEKCIPDEAMQYYGRNE